MTVTLLVYTIKNSFIYTYIWRGQGKIRQRRHRQRQRREIHNSQFTNRATFYKDTKQMLYRGGSGIWASQPTLQRQRLLLGSVYNL